MSAPSRERCAAPRAAWRGREFLLPGGGEPAGGAGLYQVHQAKSQGLAEVEAGLAAKRLLNLNELGAREELIPALTPFFPKSRERDAAAREIYYLTGSLSNVGGIAHRKLLTGEQFRQLKPLLRGAQAGAVPARLLPVVRHFSRRVLAGAPLVERARLPRRPDCFCRRCWR